MGNEAVDFIAALIDEGKSAKDWVNYGKLTPLFINDWEINLHDFFMSYVQANGKLPPLKLMQEKFDDPFKPEAATAYSFDRLKDRFVEGSIREGVSEASPFLTDEAYNPEKALELLSLALTNIRMATSPNMLVNSLLGLPEVWLEYQNKLGVPLGENDLFMGWPTLDEATGGLEGGDMVSLVGRPATGKTWFLLWTACKAWEQNRRPAFVTLEMPAKQILQRQLGIMAGIDYGPIKSKVGMPSAIFKQIEEWIADISKVKDALPFYVIDSRMASTVPDIETYVRAIGADTIYIDGAYLLRHQNSKLNRYDRVAENVDMLKDLAMRMDMPVICSWQFNREAAKKYKKAADETPDLEDIGYSDAIGQHSSIVLGLLQENSVETEAYRKIHILKGRGGEQGQFLVHWDFIKSEFGESNDAIGYGEMHINPE